MKKYPFTTLPSNDLGLLTRSLPIARELRDKGHEVAFCSPGKAPKKLLAESGFCNLLPNQPLYYLIAGEATSSNGLLRLLRSRHRGRNLATMLSFANRLRQSSTAEIVNIDHFMYMCGMWNEEIVRSNIEAIREIIHSYNPDVVVDFWNPFACIAARVCDKPLISIIQADMHPESQGFIWWKDAPAALYPSSVPAINRVLAEYHLSPIKKVGELIVGDRTLVVGIPQTDPLPPDT